VFAPYLLHKFFDPDDFLDPQIEPPRRERSLDLSTEIISLISEKNKPPCPSVRRGGLFLLDANVPPISGIAPLLAPLMLTVRAMPFEAAIGQESAAGMETCPTETEGFYRQRAEKALEER
jgi:hypothetical protein